MYLNHDERSEAGPVVADGATILERNFRSERGEADLVVLHEGDLVAVEVKTRGVGDLDRIRAYIADNPLRWLEDENNPARIKLGQAHDPTDRG